MAGLSAGPSQVGVSALEYASGLADPLGSSVYSGGQMSTSLATGIVAAETAQLEKSSSSASSLPAAAPLPAAAGIAAAAGHCRRRTADAGRSYYTTLCIFAPDVTDFMFYGRVTV